MNLKSSDSLVMESARGAGVEFAAHPSVETLDDYLFLLTALARSQEAPGDSFLSIARSVGESVERRDLLVRWRDEIGVPTIEGAAARLEEVPLGDQILGLEPLDAADAAAQEHARIVFLALFQHRDLLEAAASLAAHARETINADAWGLRRADELIRSRLLRSLSVNEIRLSVASDLGASLRPQLWWWSDLAELPSDALARHVQGRLALTAEQEERFAKYLERDPALAEFLGHLGVRGKPGRVVAFPPARQQRPPGQPSLRIEEEALAAATERDPRDLYPPRQDLVVREEERRAILEIESRGGSLAVRQKKGDPLRLRGSSKPLDPVAWSEIEIVPDDTLAALLDRALEWWRP